MAIPPDDIGPPIHITDALVLSEHIGKQKLAFSELQKKDHPKLLRMVTIC
jgi:hypothetical protein